MLSEIIQNSGNFQENKNRGEKGRKLENLPKKGKRKMRVQCFRVSQFPFYRALV